MVRVRIPSTAALHRIQMRRLRHNMETLAKVRGIASDASFDGCGDRDLVRDLGFRGLPATG